MIMKLNHHVVECPTCGHPVDVQLKHVNRYLACRHCGRRVITYRATEEQSVANSIPEHSMHECEDRSWQATHPKLGTSRLVILVEHRDEVFAHLAARIEQLGMVVVRATSVAETLRLVRMCESALVVSSCDLPDQNGWVLADKLRRGAPHIETWLYMPEASSYAGIIARFVKVTELFVYGADVLTLSDAVIQRLAGRRKPSSISQDTPELPAA